MDLGNRDCDFWFHNDEWWQLVSNPWNSKSWYLNKLENMAPRAWNRFIMRPFSTYINIHYRIDKKNRWISTKQKISTNNAAFCIVFVGLEYSRRSHVLRITDQFADGRAMQLWSGDLHVGFASFPIYFLTDN